VRNELLVEAVRIKIDGEAEKSTAPKAESTNSLSDRDAHECLSSERDGLRDSSMWVYRFVRQVLIFRSLSGSAIDSMLENSFPIPSSCQSLNMALPDEENTQLTRFRAQYLQVLDPGTLSWPPHAMLKKANVQAWLFKNLFDKQNLQYLPSDRYQARVLKILLSRIEESIEDPDQDVSAITSNPCTPSSSQRW